MITHLELIIINTSQEYIKKHETLKRNKIELQYVRLFNYIYSIVYNTGPVAQSVYRLSYGLDGPGIESRWGRDFPHLSIPALGPTQPLVHWVTDLSRG
jgi:hypothetical protein